MEIQLFTQPKMYNGKNYSLGGHLEQLLMSKRPKYTDLSLFFGLVKENAYEKLYPTLKMFIIDGGNIKFYLSPEKKGNTKKIVNSLLELGCETYLFTGTENDFIPDFQYKGAVFTSARKAVCLLSSGNFSMSGLYEGHNIITQFTYNLAEEKDLFEDFNKKILPEFTMNLFEKVTRENFDTLLVSSNKPIVSIEEFTKKDIESAQPILTSIDDLSIDIEIDKDVDFLVPTEHVEKVKKEKKPENIEVNPSIPEPIDAIEFKETKYYMDNDALDIENMLFANSYVPKESVPKIIKKNIEPSIIESDTEEKVPEDDIIETKILAKSTNLSKTSIFMIQTPKISKRGASAGEIKIPVYLRDLIPAFWDWPKEYSVAKNSIEKLRTCTFKIIDTQNPNIFVTDESVRLFQREGENSFIILSDKLIRMDLQENDIIRFIKTHSEDSTYYTCEVVRQDAKEYPIWEQFCTHLLKGSKRKYGIM